VDLFPPAPLPLKGRGEKGRQRITADPLREEEKGRQRTTANRFAKPCDGGFVSHCRY